MNERIRLLAVEAGTYQDQDIDGTRFLSMPESSWAKFAESLIEECIQVLKDTGYPNAHGNCVGVEELKQHFGIK